MRRAGAGSRFVYSAAHQAYIHAARLNRIYSEITNPFWAYRASEVAPQVGDFICTSRSNSGATYDNIADPQIRAAHCDIVTKVSPGSLRVIGGNVRHSVDAKTVRTLADGRLALDGDQARFFAVVRCRGGVSGMGSQHESLIDETPTGGPLYVPNAFEHQQGENNFNAPQRIRWIQESLNKILGLQLKVDGIMGQQTRNAIRLFQKVTRPANGACCLIKSSNGVLCRSRLLTTSSTLRQQGRDLWSFLEQGWIAHRLGGMMPSLLPDH